MTITTSDIVWYIIFEAIGYLSIFLMPVAFVFIKKVAYKKRFIFSVVLLNIVTQILLFLVFLPFFWFLLKFVPILIPLGFDALVPIAGFISFIYEWGLIIVSASLYFVSPWLVHRRYKIFTEALD
ncbi:MAG: hypothetical protein V7784_06635 [Oceanospirillaceae bacterium]